MLNIVRRSNHRQRHVYFPIISLDVMNFKKNQKINNLLCQTYSWNKGGLKLFRFWEYGPMRTFSYMIRYCISGLANLHDVSIK